MRDRYDLPVSTASAAALQAYDAGVRGLLGWEAAALDHFRAALAHDPGFALAHAGAAVCLFLDERFAEARQAAAAARAAAAGASAREQGHVEALARLVSGQVREAEAAMREHLEAWPRDLVVAQRLYYIWFWQGRFPEMLALTGRLAPHSPGDSYLLGMHAFALEEAGRCDEAVRVARAAITRHPGDAWAVHALAHALYEMAAFDTGIATLPPAIRSCRGLNWFRNHLIWHLALMYFARGDERQASRIARRAFERAPSSVAGDLHDSISMLWRLALVGHDVRHRWPPFAAIARERLDRQSLLFHAAHLAMALAGAGDWATAERQLEMLRERAGRDRTGLTGEVLIPLIEGLHAFARGEWKTVIERIEPIRPRVIALGGSRAQRDVFHDTYLEACFRAGDAARARRLVEERVLRRPDRYWVVRQRRWAGVGDSAPAAAPA
jgi:tetratricopeptide (TPR) repeat protein